MFVYLRQEFKNFKKDKKGNLAIIFSLSIFVLFGAVGFAIDVSRSMAAQSALQNAIDKAVLSLAKDMASDVNLQGAANATARTAYVQKWIDANRAVRQMSPTFSVVLGANDQVNIDVGARVKTSIMKLFGKDHMDVNARSQAVYSSGRAEIALILDTTGSMEGSKIDQLRLAATQFTNNMFDQPDSHHNLKMSVVPFAQYVNVGMQHANKPWLNKPADEIDSWTYDTFCRHQHLQRRCDDIRDECDNAGEGGGCWTEAIEWCDNGGANASQCVDIHNDMTRTWQGCVKPRTSPYNTDDDFLGVANNDNKKYPGKLGWCPVRKMLPLRTNRAPILNKIDELYAYGLTHIPVGLSWGWHLLSHEAPFRQGVASSNQNWSKFIVLMTDGENTKRDPDDWDNVLHDYDADNTMATLCTNIKAAGIQIFTIAFEISNQSTKEKIRNCATQESFFYDASNASGVSLMDAFSSVSDTISNLRISK